MQFSPLIVGTMRLGVWGAKMSIAEQEAFLEGCLDMDLIDIDLADIYGDYTTEKEIGEAIKHNAKLKQKLRFTSKCGIKLISGNRPSHKIKSYDSSASHILKSVDQTLSDLGVEQIALLLIHRPDYLIDSQEVAQTFETLKASGKVESFGVSNFSTDQFDLLNGYCPLVTNQIEVSVFQRAAFDNGVLDQCQRMKITPTAWSPIGGGARLDSDEEAAFRLNKVCSSLAEKYDMSKYDVLYAWLNTLPHGLLPVVGTSKLERVASAKQAMNVKLSHEEWYEIWQAAAGVEVP